MSEDNFTNQSQILLYQTEDGRQRIEVRLQEGSVWLSQKGMAELLQTTPQNINMHLKNIFSEGEILPEAVIKDSLITASDGKKYRTQLYRLEAIIAIGYRVSSHRGTQFRQWATQRLKDFIVKGFTLDDERLSKPGGMDYFDELLDRIRMADWKTKLDAFLQLNDDKILTHAGKISAEMASELALSEFAKFEEHRKREELTHSEEELQEVLSRVMANRETPASDP